MRRSFFNFIALGFCLLSVAFNADTSAQPHADRVLRVATFNVSDVRTVDLLADSHPRLIRIAEEIRELSADIILLNEFAYDQEGDPWWPGGEPGQNGRRFTERYLPEYTSLMLPSNTGIHSGFDLDNDGEIVSAVPELPAGDETGSPGPQTAKGRAYGRDAFGFGTFPGQYGMVLLVRPPLAIDKEHVRSFQHFLWSDLPDALAPIDPATGEAWYSEDEWAALRLSSKTHLDVPVIIDDFRRIHILASHPTPPVFDGPEGRNKLRNHDEIAFWSFYLNDASFIIDDAGVQGGLSENEPFVILGDLNADPDEGSSWGAPLETYLFSHPRVNGTNAPKADRSVSGLDDDDTASWGMRADYVLPSTNLTLVQSGVHRHDPSETPHIGDHYPVWIDLDLRNMCPTDGSPYLMVLGVTQDAGYPQAGTKQHPAFEDWSQRFFAASLAVIDPASGQRWLYEATPDIKDQLHHLDRVFARPDIPGLDGVFLTHAHMGHYTGLMHFGHEVMGANNVPVYAMPRMSKFLSNNGPWDQLVRYNNIALEPLTAGESVALTSELSTTPMLVPHRDEYSETVGYRIDGPHRTVLFIPDINKWEVWDSLGVQIENLIEDVDFAFIDGTFFSSKEVGGRDMSAFPHPSVSGSMERFASLDEAVRNRIYFIHFNHTNPLLDERSEARATVIANGFNVASEGQCIRL